MMHALQNSTLQNLTWPWAITVEVQGTFWIHAQSILPHAGNWGENAGKLSWLSDRALSAQARGVLGSTPGDCCPVHWYMLGEYFCNMKFVQSNTLAMYVTNLQCPKNANTVVSVVAMTVACSRVARVFHLESHCRVISPLQPAVNKHRFVLYPARVTPLAYQKWGVVSDSDIRRTRKEIHNSFRQRVYGRLGTRIFITE